MISHRLWLLARPSLPLLRLGLAGTQEAAVAKALIGVLSLAPVLRAIHAVCFCATFFFAIQNWSDAQQQRASGQIERP